MLLLESTEWLSRRVETVRLVDSSMVQRLVSLDVDLEVLQTLCTQADVQGAQCVAMPLVVLPKGLLLDLDVRDQANHALSVLASSKDSAVAQSAMVARLVDLGENPDTFTPAILDGLYRLAADQPDYIEREELEARAQQISYWTLRRASAAEDTTWEGFFRHRAFVELVEMFSLNYMPMVLVPLRPGMCIVKYRHLERQEPQRSRDWRDRLSLAPYIYTLEAPSIGRSAREHLRFESPKGLFLEDLVLRLEPSLAPEERPTGPVPAHAPPAPNDRQLLQSRVTPDRGVIYTRNFPRASRPPYVAMAIMRPRSKGFLRTAQYTTFVGGALQLLGCGVEATQHRLTSAGTSAGATLALLLAVPSTVSGFIAREDEHELLSDLLSGPRLAVAASAVLALLAAGALVIDVPSCVLSTAWAVSGIITLIVFALLRRISVTSDKSLQEVGRWSGHTTIHTPES